MNKRDIYTEKKPDYFINPFEMAIDPMERLVLINFEKDPDEHYIGFEPQVFDDEVNGKGILVIGWRVDGKVDVYHQPGLHLDDSKYNIAGKGLARIVMRKMEGAFFDINSSGAQVYFSFKDIHQRKIEVRLEEKNKARRRPFGLLAPMGHSAENPSSLPLIFLPEFYFVRKKNTVCTITINGQSHRSDQLPIPMDFKKMLFARYSPDPIVLTLNPAQKMKILDKIPLENTTGTPGKFSPGIRGEINSFGEIKSLEGQSKNETVTLEFNPSFPNCIFMQENTETAGAFSIFSHASMGRVTGKYTVRRGLDGIHIMMNPSGGWIPKPNKLSLRFLYKVNPMFKNWPKSYTWKASINLERDRWVLNSHWEKNN